MRISDLLCATAVVACLNPITSSAESTAQRRAVAGVVDEQTEPFHKHYDTRHGHDHYYPDRGAIVRDLPQGTIGTSYAGVSYRYHDGIWLEPRGPAYMVVSPPIGLVAPTLPLYSTVVTHGTESFLYTNDTYYRARPDLGGYEVVNDPTLDVPAAPEALVGGQMPAAVVAPGAAAGVGAVAGAAGAAAAGGGGSPGEVPVVAREASLVSGAMPGPGGVAAPLPAAAAGGGVGLAPAGGTGVGGAAAGAVPVVLPTGTGASGTQKVPKVFLYPKNGQSADQQARDRYDCYRFAVAQSSFDPLRTTGTAPAPAGEQQSDFDRAQSACFEGRGYSNR